MRQTVGADEPDRHATFIPRTASLRFLAGGFTLSSNSHSRIGLLLIAGAIGLYLLSFFFQFVGYFLPASGSSSQESLFFNLHVLWLPLISILLVASMAAVFVIGVWFVLGGQARFDSSQRGYLGLAALAFSVSSGAAVLRASLGLLLGFVVAPELLGFLQAVNVGAAISLGFTLYWLLLGVGIRQARISGIVALVAGSLSSALAVLWLATQNGGVAVIGATAGLISLTLWMALFLWGSEELRLRTEARPPAVVA